MKSAERAERPVPFTSVAFDDGFWAPRLRTVRETTIPFLYARIREAGMIDALDVGEPPGEMPLGFYPSPPGVKPTSPVMWWDSDVAKWIEAAAFTLARKRDPQLEAQIDDIVARIAAAQAADGYFNSYFQRRAPADRWTNLRDWHELYCAGHLIEAAVAYAAATGKRSLLEVVNRYVEAIDAAFGPEPGKRRGYCGHQEIELALIKLHRFTGEERPLRLARFFIHERGRPPHYFDAEARARGEDPQLWRHRTYEYNQSHQPVRQQYKVVGHAVRAMYMYCAMADLAAIDADAGLRAACETLWNDLTRKRLYVTGGLGPSASNEGFTRDYDLPNVTAYAETCAAVGLVFWAHRMALATGEVRYADVMERALYNGALVGLSLAGDRFTYDNPLASRGGFERWAWHSCPCCPPNIARLVASVGQYVCSVGEDSLTVHLYVRSTIDAEIGGTPVRLRQETNAPWSGEVRLKIDPAKPQRFALRLRIPEWCDQASFSINGERLRGALNRGYSRIDRLWHPGDEVELSLAMKPRWLRARAELGVNLGRVALQRGPLIYCVEEADAGADVEQLVVAPEQPIEESYDPDLLGGASSLTLHGWANADPDWGDELYRDRPRRFEPRTFKAVPYALWAHREPGTMAVWLRERFDAERPLPLGPSEQPKPPAHPD